LLEEEYEEEMTLKEAINLAFHALSSVFQKDLNVINLEIFTITKDEKVKPLTQQEITKMKKGFKAK
jgi:20S proteasome alpha/beta subunit